MKKLYLLTGANGHLGHTIRNYLSGDVREWIHHKDDRWPNAYVGDVCDKKALEPFFDREGYDEVVLIHCAAKISIATKPDPSVWETNVWGTQNILDLAKEHAIDRMIYIGSVHAIQEKAGIMTEPLIFDPHLVVGQYAKSKAEAIRRVLASDLRVVVLLPSGIIGPGDVLGQNHMVQVIHQMMKRKWPITVSGGYDFVDVRDVALAVLQAEKKGRDHAVYIVNGHEISMADLTRFITHKEPKVISAKWLERIAPMIEHLYPNMSPYALYTLQSPSQFSHQKATVDLGYQPRLWQETIQDMEMIKDGFDW